MKITKLMAPALFAAAPFFFSCGEKTDVVESGTYQGTIHEVEAEKSEIYVKTADDKTLELYFTDKTTLTRNGETVPFEQLKEGGKVEVQVEKVGNRLDPISVKITE
jgi:cold shock protein